MSQRNTVNFGSLLTATSLNIAAENDTNACFKSNATDISFSIILTRRSEDFNALMYTFQRTAIAWSKLIIIKAKVNSEH